MDTRYCITHRHVGCIGHICQPCGDTDRPGAHVIGRLAWAARKHGDQIYRVDAEEGTPAELPF